MFTATYNYLPVALCVGLAMKRDKSVRPSMPWVCRALPWPAK